MKIILKEINLRLRQENRIQKYKQNISSNVFFDGKSTCLSSEKLLTLETVSQDDQPFYIKIMTDAYQVNLDSLIKKQESMTLKMASLVDHVWLKVDDNGAITTLCNHSSIKEKWSILKKELEQEYSGDAFEVYGLGITKKLNNSSKLIEDFMQPRLFGLFWHNLFGVYTNDDEVQKEKVIVLNNCVNHIPIVINEAVHCKDINTSKDTVAFHIRGRLNTNDTLIHKINNHFMRLGGAAKNNFELKAYEGDFEFSIATGLLKHATLSIETAFGNVYSKKDHFAIRSMS